MNIQKVWEESRAQLHGKVSSVGFDLWIKPLAAVSFENGVFTLCAQTPAGKNQAIQPRHLDHITNAIKTTAPIVETIEIIDAAELEHRTAKPTEPQIAPKKINSDLRVNGNQTFDNFIVGKSNQIVCAAAEGVAKQPGKSVNPLFIYGGTGLGKTHLLNAIVNYILETNPKMNIAFASSENFTNDFVNTMRDGRGNPITAFREKYRNADILLIDDIQFIRDKKGTQEEFFHTFNDLVQNGKQVVLTSDRHPDEMPTLEERMRSRFKMGLIQDVQNPDIEMWMAILKRKAAESDYRLNPEVYEYLAKYAHEHNMNVREMEGNLTKITFCAKLRNKTTPTLDDCYEALKENHDTQKYITNTENIINAVCEYFNITRDDLIGPRRNREFVEPRMIAIYLISDILNIPLMNIGSVMGGRDHTTIMHGRNKIEGQIANGDQRIKRIVTDISKMVDKE